MVSENGRFCAQMAVYHRHAVGKRDFWTKLLTKAKHVNLIGQRYLGTKYTAHSQRASFVTVAKLAGADDSEVMNQTKHKTSEMIRRYTRLDNVRQHNAAQKLEL